MNKIGIHFYIEDVLYTVSDLMVKMSRLDNLKEIKRMPFCDAARGIAPGLPRRGSVAVKRHEAASTGQTHRQGRRQLPQPGPSGHSSGRRGATIIWCSAWPPPLANRKDPEAI